ncbi:uncharacterized protein MONOS_18153 [Monocercomonoides exilis]|uniref:uncharacterized protein n=1 Tax=Monocercomonoides exilis TaxID=2049356 RepID=UPI003559B061|nr:hypothetical protein MONOS_18153 [Monocercomonoides exilis]
MTFPASENDKILFQMTAQKQNLPFEELCSALKMNEEEMEEYIATIILKGYLDMRIDQPNKKVIVRTQPKFTLDPEQPITKEHWILMNSQLKLWQKSINEILEHLTEN